MAEHDPTIALLGGAQRARAAIGAADTVSGPAEPAPPPTIGRGTLIGRYLTLEALGAGGMGVVYAAYDPELNRRVAIKVLRPGGGSEPRSSGRARLQREAQALARLAHPNVIPVHDVGTHGDSIFMAMELVDGTTLRAWLRERRRGWREVRDAFRLAGAGLVAAHEANLVHRDFKPENVLVGKDGRVRVTDFGLAREAAGAVAAAAVAAAGEPAAPEPLGEGSSPLQSITRAGALVGTPPYMAPEQLRGQPADARSDQFSFSVAFYEGLYGVHPFARSTLELQALAIDHGVVNAPPAGARVPAWLRRVVVRGLRREPDERWPSMAALLAALGHDQTLRRRRIGVGTLLVAVVAAGAAVTAGRRLADARADACAAGSRLLAGVWDKAAAAEVTRAFAATGVSYAAESAAGVGHVLDGYAAGWTAMRDEACRATRVLGVQPQAVLDRRMVCLNRRLAELDLLVNVLRKADATVVERSVRAAYDLPAVADCSEARTAAVRPPDGAALQARVEAARGRKDRANALKVSGRFADAAAVIRVVALEAKALGYAPFLAETLLDLANLEANLGDLRGAQTSFLDAAAAAVSGNDSGHATEAFCNLIEIGKDLAAYGEAHQWARLAQATMARGTEQEVSYERQLGTLLRNEGRLDEVYPHYARALALNVQLRGPDHPSTGEVENDLGTLALAQSDFDEARRRFQRAIDLAARTHGADHPFTAVARTNLANVTFLTGHYPESLRMARDVLEIIERTRSPDSLEALRALQLIGLDEDALGHGDEALAAFARAQKIAERAGPENLDVAEILSSIGGVYHRRGQAAECLEVNQRALAIRLARLGPDHIDCAQSLLNIGLELKVMGRYTEAMSHYQRAAAIYERRVGGDHADMAFVLDNLGEVERLTGAAPAALETYGKALAISEKAFGREHPVTADILCGMGRSLVDLGRFAQARPLLERSLAVRAGDPPDDANLAETRFALAQALAPDAATRSRALALAAQARAPYAAAGAPRARQLAEVDAWLRQHGRRP